MSKIKTITVSLEAWEDLRNRKEYPRETMDSVIKRLLAYSPALAVQNEPGSPGREEGAGTRPTISDAPPIPPKEPEDTSFLIK